MRSSIFLALAVAAVLAVAALALAGTATQTAGAETAAFGSREVTRSAETERDACEIAPVVCSPILTVSVLMVAVAAVTALPAVAAPLLRPIVDPLQYLTPFIGRVDTPPPRA